MKTVKKPTWVTLVASYLTTNCLAVWGTNIIKLCSPSFHREENLKTIILDGKKIHTLSTTADKIKGETLYNKTKHLSE